MINFDTCIEIKSFKQLNETLNLLNFTPDAIMSLTKENYYQIYKYDLNNPIKEQLIEFINSQFEKVYISNNISIYNAKNSKNEITNAFIVKDKDIKKLANVAIKICNNFAIINLLNGSLLVEFYCPDIDYIELINKFTFYIDINISNDIYNIKYYKLEDLFCNNIIEKYNKDIDYVYKCNLEVLIKYRLSKNIIAMHYDKKYTPKSEFILGDEVNLLKNKSFFPNNDNINIYIPEIKFINKNNLYKDIKNNTKIFRLTKNSLVLYKRVKYLLSLLDIYYEIPDIFDYFKISYKDKMLYVTIQTDKDLENDEYIKEQEKFIEFIDYLNKLD